MDRVSKLLAKRKQVFIASSIYMAFECSKTDSISFVVIIIETMCILSVPLFFFSAVPITKYGAGGPSYKLFPNHNAN